MCQLKKPRFSKTSLVFQNLTGSHAVPSELFWAPGLLSSRLLRLEAETQVLLAGLPKPHAHAWTGSRPRLMAIQNIYGWWYTPVWAKMITMIILISRMIILTERRHIFHSLWLKPAGRPRWGPGRALTGPPHSHENWAMGHGAWTTGYHPDTLRRWS